MDIEISTSDPDAVDPAQVAEVLQTHGNYFVLSVTVNEGERVWTYDPEADLIEIDLSNDPGVVCGGCGLVLHVAPHEITDGLVTCMICGHRTQAEEPTGLTGLGFLTDEDEARWDYERATGQSAPEPGEDEPGHSEREIRQARGDIGWEGE